MARTNFTVGHRTFVEKDEKQATDWLEGIGPDVCHLFRSGRPSSLCGVPRSEQPRHGQPAPWDVQLPNFCSDCGRPFCPTCAAAHAKGPW